jgi:hypothetical protein
MRLNNRRNRGRLVVTSTAVLGAFALVGVGTLANAVPAGATPALPVSHVAYEGSAYGSVIYTHGILESSETAPVSVLASTGPGYTGHNAVAGTAVGTLLSAGVIDSNGLTVSTSQGEAVNMSNSVGNVSLLNGVIKAQAVTAEVTSALSSTGFAESPRGSGLVDLTIAGQAIPVNVAPNTVISLGALGSVTLNEQTLTTSASGAWASVNAIDVRLLDGVEIIVAHADAELVQTATGQLGGNAYATQVSTPIVNSQPTAYIVMPAAGTDSQVDTSALAQLSIPNVATVGALSDAVVGDESATQTQGVTMSTIGGISLLGGAIQVGAIRAVAYADEVGSGAPVFSENGSEILGLTILGHTIPVSSAPNQVLNIANLGTVYINRVIPVDNGITVRMLEIVLAAGNPYGLPALADIQVATATISAF